MKELKEYICESNTSYKFIDSKNQRIFEQATKYKEEFLKHKDRWYVLNYEEMEDMDQSEFWKENSKLEKLIEKCEKTSMSYYDKIYNKLNDDIEKLVKLYVEINSMSHADKKVLTTPPELEKEMYKFFEGSTLRRPTDIEIFREEIIVLTKVAWEAYTMSSFSKSRYETGQDEEWLGSILMECLLGMVYIHEVMLYNTKDIKVSKKPAAPKTPKIILDLQQAVNSNKGQEIQDCLVKIIKKYGSKYGDLYFTPNIRYWDHIIEGLSLTDKNQVRLMVYWQDGKTDGTEFVNFIDVWNKGKVGVKVGHVSRGYLNFNVTKDEVIEYINKFINEYDWSKK